MKLNTTSPIIYVCLISVLLIPVSAHAQTGAPVVSFENPLNLSGSAEDVIIAIIRNIIIFIVTIAASIALLAFLVAGTRYLLGAVSGEQEIQKAKQILFWSVIGLLVIGTSLMILQAVFYILGLITISPA